MPYKNPVDKKAHNQRYYKKWYAENGRNRAIDYLDAIIEWRRNNPEKVRAHSKLNRAIRAGKIIRPNICTLCGRKTRLSAHHNDYSKELEVEWLCSSCHKLKHPLDKMT